jgi:hypothetical protein
MGESGATGILIAKREKDEANKVQVQSFVIGKKIQNKIQFEVTGATQIDTL